MKQEIHTVEILEHKTREDYVIIEEDDNQRSETYCHGYDGEDAHLYEMINELRRENPYTTVKLVLLRTVNV